MHLSASTAVIAVLFAFWLDRAFGEPPVRWHPVVWMGKYLGWFGGRIAPREVRDSADWRAFSAGALAWYGGAMLAGLAALALQSTLLRLGELMAGLLLGVLLKPLFSWRMLCCEVMAWRPSLSARRPSSAPASRAAGSGAVLIARALPIAPEDPTTSSHVEVKANPR